MGQRIVIVGGGVIGMSVGHYCAQRGHHVTVVDRNPQQRDGCSFGNAGMIVPSHFVPLAAPGMVALGLKWMWNPESPFYIKPRLNRDLIDWGLKFWRASTAARVAKAAPLLRDLNLQSRACYEELANSGHDFGLKKHGLLMLCKTAKALEEESHMAEKAVELGVPAQSLDTAKTKALDPDITMDVAGSVYFPLDCHLQPEKFVASMERSIVASGGKLLWETEVDRWNLSSSKIRSIETSHGTIEGDHFILCGGSWSPLTANSLKLNLPMQAGKGYSLTVAKPRELPKICSILVEARIAVTPMGEALRFGGTMEISGLSEEINPRRVQGIIKAIPNYFPNFQKGDFQDIQPWRGLRPCSPDGLPYLGRSKQHPNLVVATGHAMMGLSLAPITGRLVSQIVDEESLGLDLTLLSPDRYT